MESINDAKTIVANSGVGEWDWGIDKKGNPRNTNQTLDLLTEYLWGHKNDFVRICARDVTTGIPNQLICMFVIEVLGDEPHIYNLEPLSFYMGSDPQIGRSGMFETKYEWLQGRWMQANGYVKYPKRTFKRFAFKETPFEDEIIDHIKVLPYPELCFFEECVKRLWYGTSRQ